jgi:hypothetical protein
VTRVVGGMCLEPDPDAAAVGWCECCGSPAAATYRAWSADRVDFGPWRLCEACRALVGKE